MTKKMPAKVQQIAAGMVCHLNSGGPPMTILTVLDHSNTMWLSCGYFDRNNEYHTANVSILAVIVNKPESDMEDIFAPRPKV